jgi:hypothetical protein
MAELVAPAEPAPAGLLEPEPFGASAFCGGVSELAAGV